MELLNVQDTAKALGVHTNTIRNWCDNGIIKGVVHLPSGYRRIPRSEVDRLLYEREHRVRKESTRSVRLYIVKRLDPDRWLLHNLWWENYVWGWECRICDARNQRIPDFSSANPRYLWNLARSHLKRHHQEELPPMRRGKPKA